MSISLSLVIGLVGGCLAIVGSLIILNLRSIKSCIRAFTERINKQDGQIEKTQDNVKKMGNDFRDCKVDCGRTFVSAELFLRETGYTRRTLQDLTKSVNKLDGKFTVVDKLPQICGDISREIVKEMRNGENNG